MVVKGPANKNQQPDFGRYHHSTQRGSEKIRENIEVLFTDALVDLPFSRDDEPKILDIGCGSVGLDSSGTFKPEGITGNILFSTKC
jgi:hypothetical protein